VELSVTDHGIGMSEADQQRLFTEFFRGDEAKQVAHEGTGLGLVLVKHITEEFGGEVRVKSELHKGSTFTLRLPTSKK
jgi:two-component system sensor histidine kinase SenX3